MGYSTYFSNSAQFISLVVRVGAENVMGYSVLSGNISEISSPILYAEGSAATIRGQKGSELVSTLDNTRACWAFVNASLHFESQYQVPIFVK